MRLVKLITLNKIKLPVITRPLAVFFYLVISFTAQSQDNSPYSRYGLGDKVPNTNVANRAMGGVAAGYADISTINYANPASYSFFQTFPDPGSRKISSGRAVLNIGVDAQGRTLIDPTKQERFTATNILFSQVMLGVPIRKNWGMAFGLRPVTSINYKIQDDRLRYDPNSGRLIDTSVTIYEGQGGTHLASLGTGVKFKTGKSQFLSIGANAGYLFGKKDYSTRLTFFNDSTNYASGNFQNKTSIGGLYFDAGLQYHFQLNKKMFMSVGAYGNLQQTINTRRNAVQETFVYDANAGYIGIDTALYEKDVKGSIVYPSSLTGGFVIQKVRSVENNEAGWLLGADFTMNRWDQFRSNGLADTAVKNNWQAKFGAEFTPAGGKNYVTNILYRVGFFTGPDYIYTRKTSLPVIGITAGVGLPLANYSVQARNQATFINVGFEYIKRGNNSNILKENMYRISVGFSLTDIWFGGKTKYFE